MPEKGSQRKSTAIIPRGRDVPREPGKKDVGTRMLASGVFGKRAWSRQGKKPGTGKREVKI